MGGGKYGGPLTGVNPRLTAHQATTVPLNHIVLQMNNN